MVNCPSGWTVKILSMVIKSLREHFMLLYKSLFFSSWKTENCFELTQKWILTKKNNNKNINNPLKIKRLIFFYKTNQLYHKCSINTFKISVFTKNVISPLYLWKIPERIRHIMEYHFPISILALQILLWSPTLPI